MENKGNGNSQKTNADVKVEMKEYNVPVSHGENVRYYRKMKGYSQEYMAAELNISQSKYSTIERSSIIENEDLEKISKILNIGIEWLRDIPLIKGTTIYHQDGNGTSFQNTGDVNYTIHNPIEEVKEAYKNTVEILEKNFERTIQDKNRTISDLENKVSSYIDRFLKSLDSIKK